MNAIAEAAKKRAAKLGIENQEVDESNVGKDGPEADLSHPFLGKLRPSMGGDLSPRAKRLKELNDAEGGGGGGGEQEKKSDPSPAPAAPPTGPPAAAPPPPAQVPAAANASADKKVNLVAAFSDESAQELFDIAAKGTQTQQQDALQVTKRWASNGASKMELACSGEVFQLLGEIAMGPHEKPREEALEQIRTLCQDEQVHGKLEDTGAAFAALGSMMQSDHMATQMTAIELFENLCASEMPMDAASPDASSQQPSLQHAAANATPPPQRANRELSVDKFDPTMELEDPEEAMRKVREAAEQHGWSPPGSSGIDPKTIGLALPGGGDNGDADSKPDPAPPAPPPPPPVAPPPPNQPTAPVAPPEPPQPPPADKTDPEPAPEPAKPSTPPPQPTPIQPSGSGKSKSGENGIVPKPPGGFPPAQPPAPAQEKPAPAVPPAAPTQPSQPAPAAVGAPGGLGERLPTGMPPADEAKCKCCTIM